MHPQIGTILRRVREKRPLLHHITNFVTMNDVANASLHIGATPVMAHAAEEVAEMVSKAQALVLNMGTLSPDRLEAMLIAGRAANASGVPVMLDPVGVGTTDMRQVANRRILSELDVALVRGNAAEIGVLAGAGGTMQGVDSIAGAEAPIAVCRQLAQTNHMTVVMTGERDVVSDGERVVEVANGHIWLTKLSGTGCMATAVVAAMESDTLMASVAGLAAYGVAAELAAVEARGPASFKVAFFDQLYNLTESQVMDGARLTIH